MWRIAVAAVAFYAWGSPSFDGTRPFVLERALKGFHNDINHVTRDMHARVRAIGASPAVQFVTATYRDQSTRALSAAGAALAAQPAPPALR